ncbi:MAG: YsnF/AvaK domain-containing protein [Janthinobacterium lividum]
MSGPEKTGSGFVETAMTGFPAASHVAGKLGDQADQVVGHAHDDAQDRATLLASEVENRASFNARTHISNMTAPNAPDEIVLPLYAEQIAVARHKLERKVQVHLRTVNRDHAVDELLTHERVEIERVPIGRQIDAIPANRQEGDTTIIPVVEEVVVVHRQLVLKEEIRMRRVRVTEHHRETVSLREQEATVERDEPAALAADDTPTVHKDFAP